MNNKIIGIVVAVVVIAGGAFLLTRHKGGNTEVAGNSTSAGAKTEATAQSTSLKSLLVAGSSRKCTFSNADQGVSSQGTVYVSGGKFRGDFSAMVSGKTEMSHMISDNQISYVWVDGMSSGYKMKFDANAQANAQSNAQAHAMDPNKNMNFNCGSWSADSSMFSLPSGVQFTDMTMMGASGQTTMPGQTMPNKTNMVPGTTDITAACANLAEPAKTQCMAALQHK
jgi:hypothetical protein